MVRTLYVIVGNGASLPITRIGSSQTIPHLPLLDVVVVPSASLLLIFLSKFFFTDSSFVVVQNRVTNQLVATGRRDDGLYVLERGQAAFISVLNKSAL